MTDNTELLDRVAKLPIVDIPVDSVKADGKNPNRMSDSLFDGLVKHIRDNGIINPIIVTEDMLLADGEHRLRAAKELGMTTIPARVIPNDEKLRLTLRQTMNKLKGTHDAALDAAEYKALIDLDGLVPLANYLGEDCGDLLKVLDAAIGTADANPDDYDLDTALGQIAEPITQPGDMIRMGDHVLVCGDSTDPGIWATLAAGEPFAMMMTDPPYNCAVEGIGEHRQKLTIKNDNLDAAAFRDLLLKFLQLAMQHVSGAQYIFMSSEEWPVLHETFQEAGGRWSTTIIWVKTHFVLSRRDYHPQYEPLLVGTVKSLRERKGAKASATPILYGWKRTGTRQHYDSRTETDVWVAEKPSRNEQHPTMKPVTLYRKAILLSSKPLDTVIDPFGGSGSCVIACEQTHRKCRTIELDPVYCDVIVKRWEEFTGKIAERPQR